MCPERWEQVRDLLYDAMQVEVAMRPAFLDSRCSNDPLLREEVEHLLALEAEVGSTFLESPAVAEFASELGSFSDCGALPAGTQLGPYVVLDLIGAGGMGEVYRARDTRLDRLVAIKVLPHWLPSDPTRRQRFEREARAISALQHPNICTLYDAGSDNGIDFLALELLEGETLAERLLKGRLPLDQALRAAAEVADALDTAHRRGIIHRDLKPGNIFITRRGDCKILDFGLAKFDERKSRSGIPPLPVDAPDVLSTPGVAMGTVAYMSPEQARGEELDARTDIFSLGAVLYEMATGEPAFPGKTPAVVFKAILDNAPPLPTHIDPSLPGRIDEIAEKALQKNRGARYQNASDMHTELRELQSGYVAASGHGTEKDAVAPPRFNSITPRNVWLAAAILILLCFSSFVIPGYRHRIVDWWSHSPVPEKKLLAVLPFTAVNTESETEAFAKGLAETLTSHLTRLPDNHSLQVIPASQLLESRVNGMGQARREFGINLALEGSVERAGNQVRVTYHLVDAIKGHQLRGDTITVAWSDPFALEDRIAEGVTRDLQIELAPKDKASSSPHQYTEPAAYDYYLQGRGYLQDFLRPESLQSAITVFNHAIELDGRYAPAYAGLGQAYWFQFEANREQTWATKARMVCEKAVAIDEQSSEAHQCLGMIYQGTGQYQLAMEQFQRALSLEPTSDEAIRGLASAYSSISKTAQAEETYRQAINLRPGYWRGYNMLGAFYFDQTRYAEAAKMFQQVIGLAPDNYRGYSNLGGVYLNEARYSEAIPLFQRALEIQPSAEAYSNLGATYFFLRNFVESARAFTQAVKLNDHNYEMWGNLADAEVRIPGRKSESAADYKTAISLAEQELKINPRDTRVLGDLAEYHSMLGSKRSSIEYLWQAVSIEPDNPAVRYQAALVYEKLGDLQAAVHWLTMALNAGYPPVHARDDPDIDNIRSDPALKPLLHSP